MNAELERRWSALLWTMDFQGNLLQVNAAWQQLGFPAEQLLNTSYEDWLHLEDRMTVKTFLAQLQKSPESGYITPIASRWRDAADAYRWLLWTATATSENRIDAIGLELTTCKQQETELQLQAHHYRAALEGFAEGVIVYDAQGQVLIGNHSATEMLGVDSLEGKGDLELTMVYEDGSLLSPDDYPPKIALLTGKPCIDKVIGVYQPDDTIRWLLIDAQPLWWLDAKGKPEAVVTSLHDISERKYREDEAQEKIFILAALFEAATIGIAVIDETGRFLRVNPSYCKIYGYRPDELLGQAFTILLPPTMRLEATQKHTAYLTGQADNSGTWQLQHREGTIVNYPITETKLLYGDGRQFKVWFVSPTKNFGNERLLQSQTWLRTLVAHLPLTLLCLDRRGYLMFAQGQHLDLLGLNEVEGIGKSIFQAGQQLAPLTPDFQRVLGGEAFSKTITLGGMNFDVQYVPLIEENIWIGVLVAFTDITERKMLSNRLRNAIQELKLILPHLSQPFMYVEGRKITRVNQACATLLGYTQAELLKITIEQLYSSTENYVQFQQRITTHLTIGKPYQTQCHLRKKEGSVISCKIFVESLVQTVKMIWFLEEIPDQQSNLVRPDLSTVLFNNSHDALLLVDKHLAIHQANEASARLTGHKRENLIGKALQDLDSGRQNAQFYQQVMESLARDKQWQGKIWQRAQNGAVYLSELQLQLYDAGKRETARYLAILNASQTDSANLDLLTGLPNLQLFKYSLQKTHALAQRSSRKFALLLIKIDDMDDINVKYGYQEGDSFLQKVAQNLRNTVRDSDTVVRCTGNTFGISLDEIAQPTDAGLVSQMILFKLTQPFVLDDQKKIQGSASIGIAIYPDDGESVDALFNFAQQALEQAQKLGGGQCYFHNQKLQEQYK